MHRPLSFAALLSLVALTAHAGEATNHGHSAHGHAAPAADGHATPAADAHAAPAAPSEAAAASLARLKAGNDWFVTGGRQEYDIGTERRTAIAQKQTPFCSVLSCADSRVPPEHLFGAGLGELFTVRVAGNVAEPTTVASLEYAAEHLGTPLIVVLGHERCGAVNAAATATSSLGPNLDTLLGLIRPHIRAGDPLDTSIYANTRAQTAALYGSAVLQHMVHEGKLTIVSARYDLDTGRVEFLPEVDAPAHAAAPAHPEAPATAAATPTSTAKRTPKPAAHAHH